jgi:hypothetical protein
MLIIYIGYNPIYRSFELGESMNEISDTVGGRRFLHVGTENPIIIYTSDCYNGTGGFEYHIHKSENQGDTWEIIHNTLDSTLLQSKKSGVTTNPNDSDEGWITIAGFIDGKKVYRSIDGGDNWTNESGSLPNIPINCIIQEDTGGSPSGAVYIGTDIGVFYRNDELGDWLYFSKLLPSVEVADIDIHQSTGHVYVGTHGIGIWRSLTYSDCGQNAF